MPITAALALTAANERHIVGAFRAERAVSSVLAQPLRGLRLKDSRTLREMVIASIVKRVGSDRYFLDEEIWSHRRQLPVGTIVRILFVLATVAAVAALFLYGR